MLLALCALAMPAMAQAQTATAPATTGNTIANAGEPAHALIPVQALAATPALSNPVLSPDGQFVLTSMRAKGHEYVVVHRLLGKDPPNQKRTQLDLGEKITFNWGDWASDRYVVVSLRKLRPVFGWSGELPYDRLLLIDRDTLAVSPLGPDDASVSGDEVIFWSRDGSYILLSVSRTLFDHPEVLRVEIPSNRITRVQASRYGIWQWIPDSNGEILAGIGFGGGRVKVIYRENPTRKFETLLRMKLGSETGGAEEMHIARMGADHRGYVVSRRGGDRWGLYEYDFASKSYGAAVFVHETVDLDDYGFDRDGKLRWVSYADDRPRLKWFQDDDKAFYESLEKAVPDKIARVSGSSGARSVRIVHTSSPTDPGTYYAYTEASGRMTRIATDNPALANQPLAPTGYVSYESRDGLDIPAYLTLPPGRAARDLPLVVMPHGGPFVRDVWGYDFLVQYLANRGCVVLQPNFRGSTGYGRRFEEAGFAQFGKAMQDDVDDGVNWLIAAGTVNPKRVCVVGASYGGYVAQVAAFRNPEIYRCSISIAGISDLPSMLLYDRRFLYGRVYRRWSARIRGDESSRTLKAVSALAQVQAIAMPLLIVHGSDDDRVPIDQSEKLVAALRKNGKPYQYLRIEGGDHSLSEPRQREELLRTLDGFLAANNPTDVLK